MYKQLVAAATLLGAAATAPPAQAQAPMPCGQRDTIVASLGNSYNERLAGGGLQDESSLIEIFAARETGTFTILLSNADGISCILAVGTNWVGMAPPPEPEGTAG